MTFMLNYTNPVLDLVSDAFVISEAHAELAVNPADDFEMSVGFLHDDDFMADLFSGIFADFDVSQNTGIIQGTLAEMCGTLPSTYASFEAPGSLEFSRLDVASADPECRLTSLKDWLDVLLGEGWTGPDQNILVFIEMEHLMGILFGVSPSSAHSFCSTLTLNSFALLDLRLANRASAAINPPSSSSRNRKVERALGLRSIERCQ